jgi:transcriptional regulator GlxA family with amidase domain
MYNRQKEPKSPEVITRVFKPLSIGKRKWMTYCIGVYSAVFLMCANIASAEVLNAGIVIIDNVYDAEIVAPYDVFQYTYNQNTSDYIRVFLVAPDGKTVTSVEGIRIEPDYSFDNAPPIDILVVPSTKGSMNEDLKNTRYINWIKNAQEQADYVITLCWGAFPLAATGALDGHDATTFPFSINEFAKMFPKVNVRRGVNFVVDGKYITSVGGHPSPEPALYLVEKLYSRKVARNIAEGLVMDWELRRIPHIISR